jgi:hypothetical protein
VERLWATTSAPFGGGLLSRSGGQPNLEYLVADATSWRFPQARFDCVASIAAAHHLPLAPLLARMRDAPPPAGRCWCSTSTGPPAQPTWP